MTHDETLPLLDAFLDDELDVATASAVDAHVQGCERCMMWVADRRRLRARLRAAPVRYEMPDTIRSRLLKQMPQASPRVRVLDSWPRAAAAGVVLAVGGLLIGHSLPKPTVLGYELVSAHVRAVLSLHSIDVVSSDHHTVKPWLSNRLPFSPPVPELSEQGDTLLGARVDYLNHTRVAALIYQHGRHQVDVFVWPISANRLAVPSAAAVDGYHVVGTTAGDFAVAIVSDMGTEELQTFAEHWGARARSLR